MFKVNNKDTSATPRNGQINSNNSSAVTIVAIADELLECVWAFCGVVLVWKHNQYFKGALSGLRQFLVTESLLKMIKKCFLFYLKSFLVM